MSFEINGNLIERYDTQQISDAFRKREFVIEVSNPRNSDWNDFIKFQLIQDRVDLIDAYNLGDTIKVNFNIKGRKWEKDGKVNYFSNLEAWRIESGSATAPAQPAGQFDQQVPAANQNLQAAAPAAPKADNLDIDDFEDDLPF